MSVSKEFRILADTDGKKYRFNTEGFCRAIEEKKARENAKLSKGKKSCGEKFTLSKLCLLFENRGISKNAVSNWKSGYNGPGDMEQVKLCAEILEVDYHSLLVSDKKEIKLNDSELRLITSVYSGCLDNVYLIAENRLYKGETQENAKQISEVKASLNQLHIQVNKTVFETASHIRNRLHVIIMQTESYIKCGRISIDWNYVSKDYLLNNLDCIIEYANYESREELFLSEPRWLIENYIADEIELAGELDGIPSQKYQRASASNERIKDEEDNTFLSSYVYDIKEIDADFEKLDINNQDDIFEMCGYGALDGWHGEPLFTPKQVYEHLQAKVLQAVFKSFFPELNLQMMTYEAN